MFHCLMLRMEHLAAACCLQRPAAPDARLVVGIVLCPASAGTCFLHDQLLKLPIAAGPDGRNDTALNSAATPATEAFKSRVPWQV